MEQTTNANASPRCSHVHDGGQPCGSPALRHHDFCYFHERLHHRPAHPVKTPVAFIPPLESPEAILIAAPMGSGRSVMESGWLPSAAALARCSMAQRAMRREAFMLRACLSVRRPWPTARAMSDILAGGRREATRSDYLTPEDTLPNRNYLRIHRGPLPKSGSRAHDDLIPIPDTWKYRPLKDFPLGAELDDNLLQYVRFVTRVGHEHPEYDEAMRRLSAHIATGASS